MQALPLADPGLPDLRSAPRFLLRIAWLQRWTVLGGMAFGLRRASDADRVTVVEDTRSWQSA